MTRKDIGGGCAYDDGDGDGDGMVRVDVNYILHVFFSLSLMYI